MAPLTDRAAVGRVPGPMKDPYQTLGVAKTASAAEIKKAYRKLARKLHPDMNPGDKKSEERFKEVSSSFEVVGDPKKRALFDEFGEQATRQGFDEAKARQARHFQQEAQRGGGGFSGFEGFSGRPGGAAPDDLSAMFGDIFARRQAAQTRRARTDPVNGDDAEAAIEVDLRDAVLGADREIAVTRPTRCGDCSGTGINPGTKPHRCPQCNGSGDVRMSAFMSAPCPRCQGEGEIKEPCPRCAGSGVVTETARLKVKVPPGVETGSRVRLTGQGGPGERRGEPGDLYLRITVRPHPTVQVQGRDLSLELPITAEESLLGAEVTAPTFEGAVKLKIPPASQSGKKLRLRGRGLPALKGGSTGAPRGDLYVVLQVVLPEDSPEARAATAALQKLYKSDVRKDVVL